MKIKLLRTFKDAEEIWIGADTPGMTRKVFRLVSQKLVGSKHFCCGVTIFEPGEASSIHSHPASEEIDFIIKGTGELYSEGEKKPFGTYDLMFIPEGVEHQHINTGNEPLWLLWVYTPQEELPKT